MASNSQPQLSPYDPAHEAIKQQAANEQAIDAINALSDKVNTFVYAPPRFEKPRMNPYLAWESVVVGGGRVPEYNVCYKNICYSIKANTLLDAANDGYMKMIRDIDNLGEKRKIKLSVQRRSGKRDNHIYYFLVRREKIKNPKYKSKITFTKI